MFVLATNISLCFYYQTPFFSLFFYLQISFQTGHVFRLSLISMQLVYSSFLSSLFIHPFSASCLSILSMHLVYPPFLCTLFILLSLHLFYPSFLCIVFIHPLHASCPSILSMHLLYPSSPCTVFIHPFFSSLPIHFHIHLSSTMCFDPFIFSHSLHQWTCSYHGLPSHAVLLCLCLTFTARQPCSSFRIFYIKPMHTDIPSTFSCFVFSIFVSYLILPLY